MLPITLNFLSPCSACRSVLRVISKAFFSWWNKHVEMNKTIKDGGITVGFWIIKVMTPIWNYLLSFVHLGIISTFESSKSISSFEITLWPQYTLFIKDHTSPWKYFWIIEDWGDLQNPYIHLKPHVADNKNGYCFRHFSPFIIHRVLGYSLTTLLPL